MTQPDPAAQGAATTSTEQPAGNADAPWGDDDNFDADKAKKLIANLRGENTKLKNRPTLDDTAKAKIDEYDKLKAASQTELEKAQESLSRYQTDAEQWRSRAVASKVEALAAADFADPTDAVNGLDPSKYLDAGGEIDDAAIKRDLTALLEAKPHYKRPEGAAAPRSPAPNSAQGSSGGASTIDPAAQFGAVLGQALGR